MPRYDGILNLNKPAGWTSHDVVAKVRRILGERRVGHAGTLDPLATGVLLLCVGQATRVVEYLAASDKTYRAQARLGITTDTFDITGEIVAKATLPDLSAASLERSLARFVGDLEQVPPAYSAIKQNGVPLYRRVRQGQQVVLRPRPVTITQVELISWDPPDLTFEVTCGPGTYVRSMVHDLGQSLGCGAALAGLVRLRSGSFRLAEAVTLDVLIDAGSTGAAGTYVQPMSGALADLIPVTVAGDDARRLASGQPLPAPVRPNGRVGYAQTIEGHVLAILAYDEEQAMWRPRKVFAVDRSDTG